MAEENRIENVKVTEAVARTGRELREGEKPSAPPNLVLPKPVKVPIAPAADKSGKK